MKLDKRLSACADFIDKNSVVADIGTDHAYLPVWLVKNGICSSALACDIGEGPLESAKSHIEKYGLSAQIKTCLSDGLKNVPGENVTTIVIAGMGGETIVGILSACDWAKNCNLVLQPMTKDEDLREWLFENGYEIKKEKIVIDGKFIYTVMKCVFSGAIKPFDRVKTIVGGVDTADENAKAYIEKKAKILENTGLGKLKSDGLKSQGQEDLGLCRKLRELLK